MLIKVQLYFKNWTCKNYTYAPKKKKKIKLNIIST